MGTGLSPVVRRGPLSSSPHRYHRGHLRGTCFALTLRLRGYSIRYTVVKAHEYQLTYQYAGCKTLGTRILSVTTGKTCGITSCPDRCSRYRLRREHQGTDNWRRTVVLPARETGGYYYRGYLLGTTSGYPACLLMPFTV